MQITKTELKKLIREEVKSKKILKEYIFPYKIVADLVSDYYDIIDTTILKLNPNDKKVAIDLCKNVVYSMDKLEGFIVNKLENPRDKIKL